MLLNFYGLTAIFKNILIFNVVVSKNKLDLHLIDKISHLIDIKNIFNSK